MIRILLLLVIVLAIFYLPAYLRMPKKKRQRLNWVLLAGILSLIILRYASGIFALIIPLVAALIAGIMRLLPILIRYAPLLQRLWFTWRRQRNTSDSYRSAHSVIETRYLRLHIDTNGRLISGQVISGRFASRSLQSLSKSELQQLLNECADDKQSIDLLRQILKQQSASSSYYRHRAESNRQTSSTGKMSVKQAYKVLGLTPKATRQEIIAAHRRLIQKAHPDRGGSAELAAQINEARDVLLK